MKPFPGSVRLEVLSPVHIGTGELLDPLEYVMREEEEGIFLYRLDLTAWLADQPEPDRWVKLFTYRPLTEIRKELSKAIDPHIYGLCRIRVTASSIFDKYNQELGRLDSRATLNIAPHLHNPHRHAALLPGSSVKGAIRTAIIDYLDQNCGLELRKASQRDLEREKEPGKPKDQEYQKALKKALGPIKNNAMRGLRVGDFEAKRDSTFLVEAKEIRKDDKKDATPKSPCEVLCSRLLDGSHHQLYGRIYLEDHFEVQCGSRKEVWDWNVLAKKVNHFYRERFEQERKKFYADREELTQIIAELSRQVLHPAPGEMVLRVGHYSHIECVTITDNAPRTPSGTWGTTRTLADGKYPFGWIKLVPCSEEEFLQGVKQKEEHDSRIEAEYQSIRKQKKQEAQRLRREAAQKRAEAERAARIEAERKRYQEEKLRNLSPVERDLYRLRTGEMPGEEVASLCDNLSKMGQEQRIKYARALKTFWQKTGQWKPKRKNRKQWRRVQMVKEILDKS